jgi:hypothetical protein
VFGRANGSSLDRDVVSQQLDRWVSRSRAMHITLVGLRHTHAISAIPEDAASRIAAVVDGPTVG